MMASLREVFTLFKEAASVSAPMLYASLVARVTQASMLLVLLYLAPLKLPMVFFVACIRPQKCPSRNSKAKTCY